jgi:spore germination protein GerM
VRLRGVIIFTIMILTLFACGDPAPHEIVDMAKAGVPMKDTDMAFVLPDSVSIFFQNSRVVSEETCTAVYPVRREWCQEDDSDILDLLIAGPTMKERSWGYITCIPEGVTLRSLQITDSTAHADFSHMNVMESCSTQAVRAQIERTLTDLSWVRRVVISVDGNVEKALQP